MKLELVTLTGPKVEQDVYEVALPTADGRIVVLPGHMPLVSLAIPGVISVRHSKTDGDDKVDHFATNGGIIEITDGLIRVLVDEADRAEDIVASEEREALERAKEAKAAAKDSIELSKAQELIDRQAVRLKVAELSRHRKGGPRI